MKLPQVSEFMSAAIHTIGPQQTLTEAHRVMRDHQVRHLPVVQGDRVVGLVSMHDLHLVETFRDADPDAIVIEEAMSPEVVSVPPDTPLDLVAEIMADRKLGSVVVARDDHVEGIFTNTDALKALCHLLRQSASDPA